MLGHLLPRDVKKAVDLLQGNLRYAWKIGELARLCGLPRRTLEKHFRRFLGCSPLEYLRGARLDQARRKLARAAPSVNVTEIAGDCGFNHLGRFAIAYRDRYAESPSDTLRRSRIPASAPSSAFRAAGFCERPTLAIIPFGLVGEGAACMSDLGDEIAAALGRTGWIGITPAPAGRYQLHGTVRDDGSCKLRIKVMLLDRYAGRYIWADFAECAVGDTIEFRDWLSGLVAGAVRSIVRDAEIDRAARRESTPPTAWKLSMRALSIVMAADPATHQNAIELLEKAMELAPRDPVPSALAAWCRAQRAGHHFTGCRQAERDNALRLASDASPMSAGDPLAATMLAAAYMLAHDLVAAEAHARRALSIDGGSAWAWGRLGWVHAYRDDPVTAIEYFKIAQVLALDDPLSFLWSIGVAAANFELGRYDRAVQWYQRSLVEQPKATWVNRFQAPALLLADKRDWARQSMTALRHAFPDLTVVEVRTGLPHTSVVLDRVADGLESLGMPLN